MAMKPIAKAEMLIRRPVTEVFEAFVNPAITSKFWFSKGSDRLEAGRQVTWDWEMYKFSVPVDVKVKSSSQTRASLWNGQLTARPRRLNGFSIRDRTGQRS